MGSLIDWAGFTWEAFATLWTGGLAVAGATIVGMRQAAISAQQTKILSRQVAVAEIGLRHELFDRRWSVFDATRAILSHIILNDKITDNELMLNFRVAVGESVFLYREEVVN